MIVILLSSTDAVTVGRRYATTLMADDSAANAGNTRSIDMMHILSLSFANLKEMLSSISRGRLRPNLSEITKVKAIHILYVQIL